MNQYDPGIMGVTIKPASTSRAVIHDWSQQRWALFPIVNENNEVGQSICQIELSHPSVTKKNPCRAHFFALRRPSFYNAHHVAQISVGKSSKVVLFPNCLFPAIPISSSTHQGIGCAFQVFGDNLAPGLRRIGDLQGYDSTKETMGQYTHMRINAYQITLSRPPSGSHGKWFVSNIVHSFI
ncbi:uncharacterized protein BYT42DRAFT_195293 [Radiomyces spectabilis]|uniref:uncharacterized protein n=1 Tax=Radiomyces spectabilis TaxID=64574 RepID=UPI002220615D|nr:uncharacterized protein BYT42DRAFT_195293 [Radiomyces spectabilis]KAI8391465.1 hypothetical protein BYT42DRAFT_195293 [Radiomyces spectabilis]